MSLPILTTKLFIPPSRPDLVPRTRLIEQLNFGLSRKLTLISAPAGFGKSTLLSSWVAQNETIKVAWVSLDEGDNDLTRFLQYFVSALQTIENKLGENIIGSIQSSGTPNTELVLTTLINEIIKITDEMILILDDYHMIESKQVHQAVTYLLDHLPINFHLIIATRIDPPFPLARLRARAQMIELRTSDLRFTDDEATAFLNQGMSLGLSEENIIALGNRTEGWIAGLQLAALSIQDKADATDFIQTFTGSHHHILDYLVEEVLTQQSPEMQSFLLHTSILERLNGPLCEAVCEYGDNEINGQTILEHLAKSNLFVVSLDDERLWYRYHHLFADLLYHRLKQIYPEKINELHIQASIWLEDNGFIKQAIQHALQMADKGRVINLLEFHAKSFLYEGETQIRNMVSWFKKIPANILQERPLLLIYLAWALMFENPFENYQKVEQILSDIKMSMEKGEEDPLICGHVASIQGFISQPPIRTDHNPHKVVALLKKAQVLLPLSETKIRSDNHINLGYEYMHLEDTKAAIQANQAAYNEAQSGDNHLVAIVSIRNQAWINYCLGNLVQAIEICQNGLSSFKLKNRIFPGTGILHIMLGYLLVEIGELDRAENELSNGFDLLRWFTEYEALTIGLIALSRLLILRGGDVRELEIGEKYERHWSNCCELLKTLKIIVAISRLEKDASPIENIQAWLQEHQPRIDVGFQGISPWAETQHLTYITWIRAQIFLHSVDSEYFDQAHLQQCLDYLVQRLQSAKQNEVVLRIIEISAIKALVLDALGADRDQVFAALEHALELGASRSYVRVFLELGSPIEKLLREISEIGNAPNYVAKLIAAFEVQNQPKPTPQIPEKQITPTISTSHIVEPLTHRELEVLCLMAEGLTYNEIAGQIMVSLNTVRTHVKNIYSKLYVNKRSQAIAKAKELNIL